ncbi:MAG: response regulator transcription factor [Treponema sp.]|nr:response regulator transcription factor [Treponema sp.]
MINKPSLIIIEDHPVMREGLASYFLGTDRWSTVEKAADIETAKEILLSHKIPMDFVILDIQLGDEWGIDIIPWLKQQYKDNLPIIAIYSAFDSFAHVSSALTMGAKVYMCKRRSEQELEQALFQALEGKSCIDDSVQEKLNTTADLFSLLTKRESEILTMVKCDLSNNQIAARLGISHRTVENILSCVYDKTGIKSRSELQKM